jgi:hypothetical protein
MVRTIPYVPAPPHGVKSATNPPPAPLKPESPQKVPRLSQAGPPNHSRPWTARSPLPLSPSQSAGAPIRPSRHFSLSPTHPNPLRAKRTLFAKQTPSAASPSKPPAENGFEALAKNAPLVQSSAFDVQRNPSLPTSLSLFKNLARSIYQGAQTQIQNTPTRAPIAAPRGSLA